jgi:hypothetical protein
MTRAADMTTWSAFCGGVQSNCVYRKIYEQIVGSANDLIPTVFNTTFGPNCSGGTAITCAADFAIDGTSGLPTMTVGTGTNGASTPSPEYSIAGDAAATGIGSGTGKMTVFLIGKNIQQSGACCGSFGRSHAYNAGNAQGTDYILMMPYGTGIPNGATCPGGSTTFCIGVDEESQGQIADLPGQPSAPYNVPVNVIAMVNIDPAGAVEKAYLNGNQIYSHTGNPPLNVPGSIHLGGGGDLSQPGQITFRDGALITGTAMSGADFTALTNNTRAFYSGLSFP